MDLRRKSALLGLDKAYSQIIMSLNGRPGQSWIFHGPSGTGKSTFAAQVAKFLLAAPFAPGEKAFWDSLQEDTNDNHLIEVNNHPDLLVIQKEERSAASGQFSIDNVRGIQDFVKKTSRKSAHKVVIIQEAQCLTRQAANALLKVLEEPPKGTFMFLLTERLSGLLPTIQSRAQKIQFSAPERALFYDHFSGQRDLAFLREISQGRIGVAKRLIEEDSASMYSDIIELYRSALLSDDLVGKCQTFSRKYGGLKSNDMLVMVQDLALLFLQRIISFCGHVQTTVSFLENEKIVMSLLLERHPEAFLWQLWVNIQEKFQEQRDFHLDPSHLLINTFLYLGKGQRT